jgi:hypothetical protein
MYLFVAWLALRVGRSEDAGGALAYLGSGAGRIVLGAMAVGFAGYSAWRLVDAALDSEGYGTDWKGVRHRLVAAGSGLIHGGLAFSAAKLALGAGGGGGGSSRTAEAGAATAMSLPGGPALLTIAAAILVGVAAAQLYMGLGRRFLRHMTPEAGRHAWILVAGVGGYCARGAIFAMAAWLMFRASTHHSPAEAGGLGDALTAMPAGLRAAAAAGLALFGAFSLIESWFRAIRDPRLKERVKRATQ